MKKKSFILSIASLLITGNIAFSQNAESVKHTDNQSKPKVERAVSNNGTKNQALKPASSISTEHPKIMDKKEAVKQNNSEKK